MEWFATFGAGQLDDFKVNPLSVGVYIKGANLTKLRNRLFEEPFNEKFCTTYKCDRWNRMLKKYNMKLITIDELLEMRKKDDAK